MKIMFIGDLHLDSQTPVSRLDNYRELTIKKLLSLLELAIKHNVNTIITPGDFFDKYDQPIPYLNSTMTVFSKYHEAGISMYSVIGNHDLPYNNLEYFDTTPLSLMFKSGLVKYIGAKETIDNVDIYGIDFTEAHLVDNIKLNPANYSILVAHYATDNTVAGDSIPREKLAKFNTVLLGHDHNYYPISDNILRPGSFTRRTKEQYNLKRDIIVYLLDTETAKVKELVLPGVQKAEQVFKNEVFSIQGQFFSTKNSYNDLFNKSYFERKQKNLFEIINTLPPTVYKNSINYISSYLKEVGLEDDGN